jgi:hypothetical protein
VDIFRSDDHSGCRPHHRQHHLHRTPSPSSNNLLITGANLLTLDVASGAPAINVTQSGRTLTIDSVIAGSDGLQKTGAGVL